MKSRENRLEEPASTARVAQQPDQAPQAGVSSPASVLWQQARGVRVPPVLESPAGILAMQATIGNQAARQVLEPLIQAKLAVAPAGDSVQPLADSSGSGVPPRPIQRVKNQTGMPDALKGGLEQLSGIDLSDIQVHYNAAEPTQLGAHAYTQGKDIYVAPGQEKHLPHEGWHVVQQMQGRVRPTLQFQGVPINDNPELEREADVMGAKAGQGNVKWKPQRALEPSPHGLPAASTTIQRTPLRVGITTWNVHYLSKQDLQENINLFMERLEKYVDFEEVAASGDRDPWAALSTLRSRAQAEQNEPDIKNRLALSDLAGALKTEQKHLNSLEIPEKLIENLRSSIHGSNILTNADAMFANNDWLDYMILQEVTDPELLKKGKNFKLVAGPKLLSSGGSRNAQKEYYPLLMREGAGKVKKIFTIGLSNNKEYRLNEKGEITGEKDSGTAEFTYNQSYELPWDKRNKNIEEREYRPIIVYEVETSSGKIIWIGVVHTTPSGWEFQRHEIYNYQIKEALGTLQSMAEQEGIPLIVGGDYYLTAEAVVEKGSQQMTRNTDKATFESHLKDLELFITHCLSGTNPKPGPEGDSLAADGLQTADFFIYNNRWLSAIAGLMLPQGKMITLDREDMYYSKIWQHFSDHFPIGGVFLLDEDKERALEPPQVQEEIEQNERGLAQIAESYRNQKWLTEMRQEKKSLLGKRQLLADEALIKPDITAEELQRFEILRYADIYLNDKQKESRTARELAEETPKERASKRRAILKDTLSLPDGWDKIQKWAKKAKIGRRWLKSYSPFDFEPSEAHNERLMRAKVLDGEQLEVDPKKKLKAETEMELSKEFVFGLSESESIETDDLFGSPEPKQEMEIEQIVKIEDLVKLVKPKTSVRFRYIERINYIPQKVDCIGVVQSVKELGERNFGTLLTRDKETAVVNEQMPAVIVRVNQVRDADTDEILSFSGRFPYPHRVPNVIEDYFLLRYDPKLWKKAEDGWRITDHDKEPPLGM